MFKNLCAWLGIQKNVKCTDFSQINLFIIHLIQFGGFQCRQCTGKSYVFLFCLRASQRFYIKINEALWGINTSPALPLNYYLKAKLFFCFGQSGQWLEPLSDFYGCPDTCPDTQNWWKAHISSHQSRNKYEIIQNNPIVAFLNIFQNIFTDLLLCLYNRKWREISTIRNI